MNTFQNISPQPNKTAVDLLALTSNRNISVQSNLDRNYCPCASAPSQEYAACDVNQWGPTDPHEKIDFSYALRY